MQHAFLAKIIAHKKGEIERAKKTLAESEIMRLAQDKQKKRTKRPFVAALSTPGTNGVNIIAEIKRASPSKGDIRKDLDPAVFAGLYEKGGAAAISVLTDQTFFKGSSEDLITARQHTALPVLRKDFLIDSYHLYEAVLMEADAILLIARILTPSELKDLYQLASELDLDALVEIHSEEDFSAATAAGAKLIGINNRNLNTFETDLNVAKKLNGLLNADQVAVAASGINDPEDITANQAFGIYNFLIGESIVRSDQPDRFITALMRQG